MADQASAQGRAARRRRGLACAEFMMLDALGGRHPRDVVAAGGGVELVDLRRRASVLQIARAFAPRPVIYRSYDFRTNEFRGPSPAEPPTSRRKTTR
ncbi:MAG: hypothetical protein U0Q12_03050 [Vicinamibacterales bacterium]